MNIYDIYIIAVKNTTLHILPESSLQKQGFTNPRLAVSCFQGWPPGVTNHSVCDEVQARGRLLKVILSWLGAVQILEAYNSLQQWIPDWLDFKLFFSPLVASGCFKSPFSGWWVYIRCSISSALPILSACRRHLKESGIDFGSQIVEGLRRAIGPWIDRCLVDGWMNPQNYWWRTTRVLLAFHSL